MVCLVWDLPVECAEEGQLSLQLMWAGCKSDALGKSLSWAWLLRPARTKATLSLCFLHIILTDNVLSLSSCVACNLVSARVISVTCCYFCHPPSPSPWASLDSEVVLQWSRLIPGLIGVYVHVWMDTTPGEQVAPCKVDAATSDSMCMWLVSECLTSAVKAFKWSSLLEKHQRGAARIPFLCVTTHSLVMCTMLSCKKRWGQTLDATRHQCSNILIHTTQLI